MEEDLSKFYDYLNRKELLVLNGDNPVKTFKEVYDEYKTANSMKLEARKVIEVDGKFYEVRKNKSSIMCSGCDFNEGPFDFCRKGICIAHDMKFILKLKP